MAAADRRTGPVPDTAAPRSSPSFARSGITLDLMRSDSVEFADFFQIFNDRDFRDWC